MTPSKDTPLAIVHSTPISSVGGKIESLSPAPSAAVSNASTTHNSNGTNDKLELGKSIFQHANKVDEPLNNISKARRFWETAGSSVPTGTNLAVDTTSEDPSAIKHKKDKESPLGLAVLTSRSIDIHPIGENPSAKSTPSPATSTGGHGEDNSPLKRSTMTDEQVELFLASFVRPLENSIKGLSSEVTAIHTSLRAADEKSGGGNALTSVEKQLASAVQLNKDVVVSFQSVVAGLKETRQLCMQTMAAVQAQGQKLDALTLHGVDAGRHRAERTENITRNGTGTRARGARSGVRGGRGRSLRRTMIAEESMGAHAANGDPHASHELEVVVAADGPFRESRGLKGSRFVQASTGDEGFSMRSLGNPAFLRFNGRRVICNFTSEALPVMKKDGKEFTGLQFKYGDGTHMGFLPIANVKLQNYRTKKGMFLDETNVDCVSVGILDSVYEKFISGVVAGMSDGEQEREAEIGEVSTEDGWKFFEVSVSKGCMVEVASWESEILKRLSIDKAIEAGGDEGIRGKCLFGVVFKKMDEGGKYKMDMQVKAFLQTPRPGVGGTAKA